MHSAFSMQLLTFGLNVAPQNLVNQKIQSQWARQGVSRIGKSALSRGATKAALAATAMGIDTWLNDEESDFAVAKKGYLALGYTEKQAENQVKADCVRYILTEGLSGATEGAVSAGMPRLTDAAYRGINEIDIAVQRSKWKYPKKIVQMTREEIKRSRPKTFDYFENNGRVHVKKGDKYRVKIDPPDKKHLLELMEAYENMGFSVQ